MDDTLARAMVADWIAVLNGQRKLAEAAIAQVPDDRLHTPLSAGTNSIAVIVQHLAGNFLSRWTDFLTTDGEKPWRGRDGEFIDAGLSRAELMERWGRGWDLVVAELEKLRPEDLARTVTIRDEPHSVARAVVRTISHASYHVGQIMMIGRGLVGVDGWEWQTVPPGQSEQFTSGMRERHGRS